MPQAQQPVANPFALLMDPQAIFRAIENSERLGRLHSRVCRPLDKPLLPPALAAEDVDGAQDELDLPGEEI